MNGRIPCCVPFCRRTTQAGQFSEWICGKHWALVSKRTKRWRRTADRLLARSNARFNRQYDEQGCTWTEPQLRRVDAARDLAKAGWQRCKREAIEAAAGLS